MQRRDLMTGRRVAVGVQAGAADLKGLNEAFRHRISILAVSDSSSLRSNEARSIEVLILRSGLTLQDEELGNLMSLRLIIRAGSGLDGLPLDQLSKRGVKVLRNATTSAPAVAEWAVLAMLALARRVPLGMRGLEYGSHLKSDCVGESIAGWTVGIWGAGLVGQAIFESYLRLGLEPIFLSHDSVPERFPQARRHELESKCLAHVVALPLTSHTRHLIDSRFLSNVRLKRPILICVGRLEVLDLSTCLAALQLGWLRGLGIDPIDPADSSRFIDVPPHTNLLITPHIGAQRTDVRSALDRWLSEALEEYLKVNEIG
jgi:D-3-phosphoglycerate dehydrogenase / 2-oxoglutarate reductase